MPPLPPTPAQHLTARLTALSDTTKRTQTLITRLAKLDFQPGSQPLDSDEGDGDGDVRLELGAEIHESLRSVEEELEVLRQEVEEFCGSASSAVRRRDSVREKERGRVAVLAARVGEDLKASRAQFRKAQLTAKHNADRAKQKERDLLFSHLSSGSSTPLLTTRQRRANQNLSEAEIVTQASSDVTLALRRTHALLQSELSRSRFAQETLEQSTAALADLGEKYTDLDSLLASSKTLVSTLLKSQKSDTWYLETTFWVLITTVVWLVFRRWLYGPLSWFIIWPLKIVFRIVFAVFGATSASKAVGQSAATSVLDSTSLIVKPSATGGIPRRNDAQQQQPFVRVGGGGRGYMPAQDPSPQGSYSQQVGKMAEQDQAQAQAQEAGQPGQAEQEVPDHPQFRQQKQDDAGPTVRGDGVVLEESKGKRNPKKKMWEEDVERAKVEGQRAEGSAERSRDEL